MANKKISELNETSSLNNSDIMPVVQGNETKKSALTTLISFLNNKLSFLKSSDISTTISSTSTDSQTASAKAVYSYAPPKSHASSATTYGVGTTGNYGHCRTINNLTTSSYTNGYALSAYQGYLLNQKASAAVLGCGADENHTIAANDTYEIIKLRELVQLGDYFTINSSGQIVASKAIPAMSVSVKLQTNAIANTAATRYVAIYKNDTKLTHCMSYVAATRNTFLVIPDYIMSMEANDILDIRFYGKVGDQNNSSSTTVTIQVYKS